MEQLAHVAAAIVACQRCTRPRTYCQLIAREKKAAHRGEQYWGKPVPGFGDPNARVLILGLAPAAHGANRTGRVFTGDGVGGSGEFLMAALHRAGFANIATSRHPEDGLRLKDAYIAATVRCAPPNNKPLPAEIAACADHLDAEVDALPRLQVIVALGRIAWDAWLHHLARRGIVIRPKPLFRHGTKCIANAARSQMVAPPNGPGTPSARKRQRELAKGLGGTGSQGQIHWPVLLACYHPSRQNTNTGKVTAAMYDDIFRVVKEHLVIW